MKKYKYRHLKKIANGITIAYLSSAIAFGSIGCASTIKKENLKQDYIEGNISHEYYMAKAREFNKRDEEIFKLLGIGFGLTFATDVAFGIISEGKEY